MDVAAINDQLVSNHLTEMTFRGAGTCGRMLQLAFSCSGGPRELDSYIVTFDEAIVFHLASVLRAPVRFALGTPSAAKLVIPKISYDECEIDHAEGFKLFELTDALGKPYGYYVLARAAHAEWVHGTSAP